ncbi:hypothetical protein [Hyphomonas sp.]|uniref:hypothetical protein n=1 Tax=Hyphomonas sp. TaxID=87 RepID=UPI00391CC7FD
MDQTAPPPQNPLLDEAESLIGWLIAQLEELLAPGTVRPRPMLAAICRHFLLPAEATLRRIIHLIAAKLGPAATKRKPNPNNPRAGGYRVPPAAPQTLRAPLFRLTEPLPGSGGPRRARPAPDTGPRIRNFDDPIVRAPVRMPPDPSVYEASLLRRLAALKAAFASPTASARRLQRLALRKAPEKPVLSLWRIPGYTSKPITDRGRRVLDNLNTAVARVRTTITTPAEPCPQSSSRTPGRQPPLRAKVLGETLLHPHLTKIRHENPPPAAFPPVSAGLSRPGTGFQTAP